MNRFVICSLFLFAPAVLAAPPILDSATYCKNFAVAGGSTEGLEQKCLDEERKSLAVLQAMQIAPQTAKYCERDAKAGGGSYKLMELCVNRRAAKAG